MSIISTPTQSASARLYWGLRTYAWLILLCIAGLGVLAPALQSTQPQTYEAEALVVAEQLEISSEALPRYGEAVFNSGAVALAVASNPAVDADPSSLIPDRLRISTAQDSVVFGVIGQDEDPEVAALLANTAAEAFIPELNQPGEGVGVFALQDEAQVPTLPVDEALSVPVAVVVGGIAGALFGLGLVALILVVRRPIVEPADAILAVGVPVLGSVALPRYKEGEFPGPRGVPGLASVTRWLMDVPAGTVFIASAPRRAGARRRLSVMLAVAVSRLGPVDFRAEPDVRAAMQRHQELLDSNGHVSGDRERHRGEALVIVDGAEPLDAIQAADRRSAVVLVVPRGVSRARLTVMAAEYLERELFGIILYHKRRRVRPRSGEATRTSEATDRPPEGLQQLGFGADRADAK